MLLGSRIQKCCRLCNISQKRTKSKKAKNDDWKTSWAKRPSKGHELALSYFDQAYKREFGELWPSIRIAMLSRRSQYGALINSFAANNDSTIVDNLTELGAYDFVRAAFDNQTDTESNAAAGPVPGAVQKTTMEAEHADVVFVDDVQYQVNLQTEEPYAEDTTDLHSYYQSSDVEFIGKANAFIPKPSSIGAPDGIDVIQQDLVCSRHLQCFVYREVLAARKFPRPMAESKSKLLNYYPLDASSLLPVIALGVQSNDLVLDMCAAPGGKSLAILQTGNIGGLVSNENQFGRRKRLSAVLSSYVPSDFVDSDVLRATQRDGQEWGETAPQMFDKVLVDAPCSNDRHSLDETEENNIFARMRSRERMRLPHLQTDLLCSALMAVKPGGDVVYSTCSLGGEQNDMVVKNAISKCESEEMSISVVDLSPLSRCFQGVFNFYQKPMLGQLVLPSLKANWGPMYFCKLHRST